MAAHDIFSVGLLVLGAVMSLVKLWLRLRFRLRNEQERCRYLQAAAALPTGSRVQEQREDGTHITVTVGGIPETSPDA